MDPNLQTGSTPGPGASPNPRPATPGLARRRFLRVGAVPVTMTLAARPVRAWHCNTSSAWGSAQISANTSVLARNAQHQVIDESWTIYNWKTNSTRAGLPTPWSRVKNTYFPGRTSSYAQTNFTVGTLFSGMSIPAGLASTDKVYTKLNSTTLGDFPKYMMVARLNSLFLTSVASCLKSNGVDQLPAMIDGTYLPPTMDPQTMPWNQSTIMQYLRENWIVVPS